MIRKTKDKNVRKLMRLGRISLGVTLPREFLNQLNWCERQKLVAKKVRGGILIKDWKK